MPLMGGRPPRRTVQDRMTGHDVRLTDEQVALVRRLQRGQFGDGSFDPYEVGGSSSPWVWGSAAGSWPSRLLVPPAGCGLLQRGPDDPPSDQPTCRQAQLHPVPGGEGEGRCHLRSGVRSRVPTRTDLPCPCRSLAWCTPSRWAGSSLTGPGTAPLASTTSGRGRTLTRCWAGTRCTCPRPSWPCPAMRSPTTRLPSTCPVKRRWALHCGGVWAPVAGPAPQLTPVPAATGVAAAGAGREEAQLLAAQVPQPAGRARVRPLHPGAFRALPRPLSVPAAAQDEGVCVGGCSAPGGGLRTGHGAG